jgi:glycerol-3-phosphate dehydrogenase
VQRVDLQQFRHDQLGRLAAGELDVLVVGGGIVGAGIARDAAMRGLRVGLVEQHDLASGTSSRSSRLLHGGLRYLAQGRLGLVREASREKGVLRRIAPHLAEPLPFLFPTYRRTRWPLWQLRIGVRLYDLLCGGQNLGPSRSLSRGELLAHLPGLNPQDLTGGVRYFDALTSDSRLVLDTLRSAARHGAIICNYTRLENASPCRGQHDQSFTSATTGGGVWHPHIPPTSPADQPSVGAQCLVGGRPGMTSGWQSNVRDVLADRPYRLLARSVVNATGPWADKLPHSRVRLRLTKGVHLVIDRRRQHSAFSIQPSAFNCNRAADTAVVMAHERRILFAIPWGQRVILGTTDTDYDGPIEAVRTEPADVDYILGVVNSAFPAAGLSDADVLSTWAGLRPLIASKHGGPSDISRKHQIHMPEPGWLDVAGGKLTTYRLIAEQAVDLLLRYLRRKAVPCRTAEEPLLPAEEVEGFSGILPPPVTTEIAERCCRDEWAVHLEDVMLRRTGWHYYRTDAPEVAQQVAGWMAGILGWDSSQRRAELARYRAVAG